MTRTCVAQAAASVPAGVLAATELAAAERRCLAAPRAVHLSTVAAGLNLMAAGMARSDCAFPVHESDQRWCRIYGMSLSELSPAPNPNNADVIAAHGFTES